MTNKKPESAGSPLVELIRFNRKAAEGFHAASQVVRNPALVTLIRDAGHQRRVFVEELRAVEWIDENALDGTPADGSNGAGRGSAAMALREGERAVLAEAERNEEAILRLYEGALSRIAGEAVYDMLIRQYLAVKETHGRIRKLRGSPM